MDWERDQQREMDWEKRDFKRREMEHELGHEDNKPSKRVNNKVKEAAPDSNFARRIQNAFGAIYDMGDDGLDYLDRHAPIYNQLFAKHNGDLDRIIAREKPAVLRKLADELEDIANGARFDLGESKKAKPDFLDMDKDGNKKEPMKKAIKDKKKSAVKESADLDVILKLAGRKPLNG